MSRFGFVALPDVISVALALLEGLVDALLAKALGLGAVAVGVGRRRCHCRRRRRMLESLNAIAQTVDPKTEDHDDESQDSEQQGKQSIHGHTSRRVRPSSVAQAPPCPIRL